MRDAKLIRALENLGLQGIESKVYVAALALGSASAQELAQRASIKRTTVYDALDALKQRGLMRVDIVGLKRKFVAEDPSRLRQILESKEQELETALPDFEALYKKVSPGLVKRYEGLASLKTMYTEIAKTLRPSDIYWVISDPERWKKPDPDFFHKYVEQRSKKQLNNKLILRDSDESRWYKKYEKNFDLDIKFLAQKKPLKANVAIIGKRVVFQQLVNPLFATVIEDESVADLQKEVFLMLWNSIPE